MAGEATNAASVAVLKRRYAEGTVPRACFEDFPAMANVTKKEDFVGDDYVLPLQTENPQGFGITIADAQSAMAQGNYSRFVLTRLEVFGVCRIKGQALKTATKKGGGALVDLWSNEMDGTTQTFLKRMEAYFFGAGNGVLGTIASGVSGTTVTLTTPEDVNNFDMSQKIQLVSDTTLSPTIRATAAVVTAVDRAAGTLTIAGNWSTVITGAANGDSIVQFGTGAVAGTPMVPSGLRQWLIGGSTPGTWKTLNRNLDPVRTASQVFDATGLPMDSALIDLDSLITTQGKMTKKVIWANGRDVRQLKKSMNGKVTYPRTTVQSQVAGISFEGVQFEGDGGSTTMLLSPFCPRQNAFLLDQTTVALYSAGPMPQPLDFDKIEFLRVATDDAYETRIGGYGDFGVNAPVKSDRMVGWGA